MGADDKNLTIARKRRLLLIETDALLKQMYASAFEAVGYRVITINALNEIAEVIASHRPSYIISRVILPGLKEDEVVYTSRTLKTLQEQGILEKEPIVFMDNFDTDDPTIKEALKVGIGYVIMADHTPLRTVKKIQEQL